MMTKWWRWTFKRNDDNDKSDDDKNNYGNNDEDDKTGCQWWQWWFLKEWIKIDKKERKRKHKRLENHSRKRHIFIIYINSLS